MEYSSLSFSLKTWSSSRIESVRAALMNMVVSRWFSVRHSLALIAGKMSATGLGANRHREALTRSAPELFGEFYKRANRPPVELPGA